MRDGRRGAISAAFYREIYMQTTATQPNVDYAVQAKAALSAVERLTADIDAVPQKTSMCREKWRDYGAALLAQRMLMPSAQRFGRWVKEHQLDTGLAANSAVRSDAMWLAENYDTLHNIESVTFHHPANIRTQCRDAGYEWAGETQHQKKRKENSARAKARKKRYSWTTVARQEGIWIERGGGQRQQIQAALRDIDSAENLFTPEGESAMRRACGIYVASRQPEGVKVTIEEAKSTVSESARSRFDKAIAKATAALEGAYSAKIATLQSSYEAEISKGIEARIGPELEVERNRAKEIIDRNQRMLENFTARRDGIKQVITKKDLQLILNCLHPDRAPDDRKERFGEAFHAAKKLQPYVDAFET